MRNFLQRNWKLLVGILSGAAAGVGVDLGIRGLKRKFSKSADIDADDIVDYEVSSDEKSEE